MEIWSEYYLGKIRIICPNLNIQKILQNHKDSIETELRNNLELGDNYLGGKFFMSIYAGTFDKEFITRTQKILKKYTGEFKFTLLMNCTLSLICLPIENIEKNNTEIIDRVYEKLVELGIEVNLIENKSRALETNYLKLKALRNGIAHLNITPINSSIKLEDIIIIGETENHNKKYEFKYSEDKLEKFCQELLNIYLDYSGSKTTPKNHQQV